MDNSDVSRVLDCDTRPAKTKSKKRKWREIETLRDKYRLRQELAEMDMLNEFDFSDIEV